MKPFLIILAGVVLAVCVYVDRHFAYIHGVKDGRDSIVWLEDVDATVLYPDKFCYIVNKTIHDRAVRVRMCRERFENETAR